MGTRFGCYVIGGDSLLAECGEVLLARGHEVLGVLSSAPRIVDWARTKGLRSIDLRSDYRAILRERPFEYLFAITHLAVLPEDVLGLPALGAINFHDGPLPRYAGLNAPVWALIHRETTYGITWHRMTSDVDRGDILKQRLFEITPGETSLSLNTRCFEAGLESFTELVDDLASGKAVSRPQELARHQMFGRFDRPPAACVLDWSRPADELEALVRALDFGRYDNPVGAAKVRLKNEGFIVVRARANDDAPTGGPGTIVTAGPQNITVAAGKGSLMLLELRRLEGQEVALGELVESLSIRPGQTLERMQGDSADALTSLNEDLCRSEPFWIRRLARMEPIELPFAQVSRDGKREPAWNHAAIEIPRSFRDRFGSADATHALSAAFALLLGRLGGKNRFSLAYGDLELHRRLRGMEPWVSPRVPLQIEFENHESFTTLCQRMAAEVKELRRRGTWLKDAVARFGELRTRLGPAKGGLPSVGVEHADRVDAAPIGPGLQLALVMAGSPVECRFTFDSEALSPVDIQSLARRFSTLLAGLAAQPSQAVGGVEYLSDAERRRILVDWNQTETTVRRDVCLHQLIEEQAGRTPDAAAVVFDDRSLTYRELDEQANQLAAYLRGLGVGPESLVGIHVERSIELVVAALGVLKAGAAYVPLDPSFPAERIAFMIEDSKASVLITQSHLQPAGASAARIVRIDDDWPLIAKEARTRAAADVRPENLAYVIYTSGSTGRPKGVMVEHRNVVNFFAGMDARLPHDPPGSWLAVTTLSFDISVLELFWTLSRGFRVVLYVDRDRTPSSSTPGRSDLPIDFALFFWGNDDGPGSRKYELLLESAKFADTHGFSAVWTPERHFHAFGGPYPNPSVIGAALATITSRVQIRAGSCVLPLHHPLRVAEEWAVIDNLSNGRVGVSFASGWQPHDFVLRPEAYKDNKTRMLQDVEVVRKLWRGEAVAFPGPFGDSVDRTTLPRPVQPELPVWITSAGNPETYRQAGSLGANVLTHLLGQSVEEVAGKIRVYREARAAAGLDPAAGKVTLMLHTFVGDDDDAVREIVRGPMKDYLRSSVNLLKQFAWTFPAFKRPGGADAKPDDVDLDGLSPEEMDGILEHAFARYFESSGLFGTTETCLRMIDRLKTIGVDEVACLIDFGVPTATVLAGLPRLDALRRRAEPKLGPVRRRDADGSFRALVRRHRVTHLQCTPSMARMLLTDDDSREAFASIHHVFIGGEALPTSLARDLRALGIESITNMYGPTETTVWSATHRLDDGPGPIPIGRPIANTRWYILDPTGRPVPPGVPGELHIAGDGVARGYWRRPTLTAERFVPDPFHAGEGPRMYRTGDWARFRNDGLVEFLGRHDAQVKLRGYRIELGEIESCLAAHPSVREVVVSVREDTPGDPRLVAYIVAAAPKPELAALKENLRKKVPEYMVPAHFVFLDRLPLTPNGKVDRNALPPPRDRESKAAVSFIAPTDELEKTIAALWKETLAAESVGIDDNFFDIGGHSLLVVRVHRRLKESIEQPVSLTDLYRFPTIRSFAEFLRSGGGDGRIRHSTDRAQQRKDAMQRRRGVRGERTQPA